MAKISIWNIKEEITVFLRNTDIISISDRGVTTSQDTGTFASDSTHTLDTNPTLAKNVRNVNVSSSDLTFGTDYTVNYTTGVISFVSAQTGDYIIDYDQGSTDRIYPDYPQPYLKLNQFPRVAVDIISGTTDEIGIGADVNQTEYLISITCYDKNQENVETMIAAVRSNLIDNKKNFFYSPFITPLTTGPLIPSSFGENKVMQRNQDAAVRFIFEN